MEQASKSSGTCFHISREPTLPRGHQASSRVSKGKDFFVLDTQSKEVRKISSVVLDSIGPPRPTRDGRRHLARNPPLIPVRRKGSRKSALCCKLQHFCVHESAPAPEVLRRRGEDRSCYLSHSQQVNFFLCFLPSAQMPRGRGVPSLRG